MRENNGKWLNPPPHAGFGHFGGRIGKNRKGFTLSEVLITLVVIGIVAAITIPAISRSSEKYILKNQFKKAYSTLLTAVQKTDKDLGGNVLCYYASTTQTSECELFYNQMFKNLSIQKICNGNAKRDGCIPTPYMKKYITESARSGFRQNYIENSNTVANLADGTIIIRYYTDMPLFLVDINGAKNPNELGKDIFIFRIYNNDNGLYFSHVLLGNDTEGAYFTKLSDFYKE